MILGHEQQRTKPKKPKREIDNIEEIKAESLADLEEKLKTMKISKKLKKKLLKDEAEREKLRNFDEKIHCYKCKEAKAQVIIRGDRICEACLKEAIIHKFKSNLRTSGSNSKIWKDDSNLICVSGGSNSMALLHLIYDALFGVSQRKMFFNVHVLYIDETAVYGWDKETSEKNIKIITDSCQNYGFNYTIIPIECVFEIKQLDPNTKEYESRFNDLEFENKHYQAIDGSKDKFTEIMKYPSELCSSREDMIFYFKKWLMLDFALTFGFKKLLLGCSALSVTTKVLSEIGKGRGLSLPNDVCYQDDRYLNDINILNPMRDFLQKEVAVYNKMCGVQQIMQLNLCITSSKKGKNLPGFGNMNLLCEQFMELQTSANAQSMHTVLRTSNKLKVSSIVEQDSRYCPLCYGIVDHATNILEVGSNVKAVTLDGVMDLITSENDTWNTEFEQQLCYGCKRLMENSIEKLNFIEAMPEFIRTSAGLA